MCCFKNLRILCESIPGIAKGMVSRFLFLIYNSVAVWRTIVTFQSKWFWLMILTSVPSLLEAFYSAIVDQLGLPKW